MCVSRISLSKGKISVKRLGISDLREDEALLHQKQPPYPLSGQREILFGLSEDTVLGGRECPLMGEEAAGEEKKERKPHIPAHRDWAPWVGATGRT